MRREVIGIDFGNSQSSIATWTAATMFPQLLHVDGGREGVTIPTVLALNPNNDSVEAFGNEAKKYYLEEKRNVKFASDFKRDLGKNAEANRYCKLFLQELAKFMKARYNVKELDPQNYAACIAHPATWTKEQVDLLKKYASEAGFPSEPEDGVYSVEDSIAVIHALKNFTATEFRFGDKTENYMVIDFGDATFDICVIRTSFWGNALKIISTSGDPMLGGRKFDEIIEYLFFKNNESIVKSDLSERELAELRDKCKKAKEGFSENFRMNDVVTQPFHISRGQYSLTISKQEFQNICKDRGIFEKIKRSIHEALDKAGTDVSEIKKVILTGGSAKWYFLREIVANEFAFGEDAIFLTEHPFTDVASGCAIKAGFATSTERVWVKYKLGDDGKWSDPKCILNPGRNVSPEEEMMYIGTIVGTQYVKPYRITLSWWTGFDEENLQKSEDDAVVEFYARSNWPPFDRLKRVWQVLRNIDSPMMPDEYKIFLRYQEDKAGSIKYRFEIMDAQAALKESKRLREGDAAVQNMPDGHREVRTVLPGFISSFRAFKEMRSRKLTPLKKGAE